MPRTKTTKDESPSVKARKEVVKLNKTLERLEVVYRAPGDIRPNSYNPNRQNEHEFTMLCRSISEDGFTQPVLVAEDGVTIVDGEHRWRAAQHLGLPEIPVVVLPMEEAQARIATLRHNRARGSEDIEAATAVLRDLERMGNLDWATDSLDMSDEEIQRLLADIPAPEANASEEFGEAWAPMGHRSGTAGEVQFGQADQSPAAISASRENEERLAQAKTEEERQAILRDAKVWRLVLQFSGEDEVAMVKRVLGDKPATTVLQWCQQAEAHPEEVPA
jgi:ParB/RepB/Spo0J family partition protein